MIKYPIWKLSLNIVLIAMLLILCFPPIQADAVLQGVCFRGTLQSFGTIPSNNIRFYDVTVEQIIGEWPPSVPPSLRVGILQNCNVEPGSPAKVDNVSRYDRVEVCGWYMQGTVKLGDSSHYLKKISLSQNRPDLTVTKLDFNKSPPFNAGDIIYFYADIANLGNADAVGFKIDVYLDGKVFDSGSGYSLAAQWTNRGMRAQYSWTAVAGNHSIKWVLDGPNTVSESNENNNVGERSFRVESPVSPPPIPKPEPPLPPPTQPPTGKSPPEPKKPSDESQKYARWNFKFEVLEIKLPTQVDSWPWADGGDIYIIYAIGECGMVTFMGTNEIKTKVKRLEVGRSYFSPKEYIIEIPDAIIPKEDNEVCLQISIYDDDWGPIDWWDELLGRYPRPWLHATGFQPGTYSLDVESDKIIAKIRFSCDKE